MYESFMVAYTIVFAIVVAMGFLRGHVRARRIRKEKFLQAYERYELVSRERKQLEKELGEENVVTHFSLQKLIRQEVCALLTLCNYYPAESYHLEGSLLALLSRVTDEVTF